MQQYLPCVVFLMISGSGLVWPFAYCNRHVFHVPVGPLNAPLGQEQCSWRGANLCVWEEHQS